MVDRLIEKTGPAVQLESGAQTKGERTRERILDVAYQAIVEKGFAATSIEELVEAAGITKSGFFYHFRDKNDMARQLFDRFLAEDEAIIDTLETARARTERRSAAELPHLPQPLRADDGRHGDAASRLHGRHRSPTRSGCSTPRCSR